MSKEESIKKDYNDGYSLRAIALKYGVPKSTIARWAKQYGWVREKIQPVEWKKPEPRKAPDPDTFDPIPAEEVVVQDDVGQESVGQRLMGQLEWDRCPDNDDFSRIRAGAYMTLDKAEQILKLDDALAPRDLKSISGMLLDVKNVLHAVSPWEKRKLALELDALARQVKDREEQQSTVRVEFVDTDGAEI